jgi:hypothetical protein
MQISYPFLVAWVVPKNPLKFRSCVTFRNKMIFFMARFSPSPAQHPSWRTTTVGYPRQLIQYIHSYPPYLVALKKCHAEATGTHMNSLKCVVLCCITL